MDENVIAILSEFCIYPRRQIGITMKNKWDDFLVENTFDNIFSKLFNKGLIISVPMRDILISRNITKKEIQEILRENKFKISCNKTEVVDRLLENFPKKAKELVEKVNPYYMGSDEAKKIVIEWKKPIHEEGKKVENKIRQLVKEKKIDEALIEIDKFIKIILEPLHGYYGIKNWYSINKWKFSSNQPNNQSYSQKDIDIFGINAILDYEPTNDEKLIYGQSINEYKINMIMSRILEFNTEDYLFNPNKENKKNKLENIQNIPSELFIRFRDLSFEAEGMKERLEYIKSSQQSYKEYLTFLRKTKVKKIKIYFNSEPFKFEKEFCKNCINLEGVYDLEKAPAILPNPKCLYSETYENCHIRYIGTGKEWEEYRKSLAEIEFKIEIRNN